MTLTTEDLDDIRTACQHLALCWDSLKAVDSRHNEEPIEVDHIDELTASLDYPPDSSVLTDEFIRYHLQSLQGDGQAP